MNTAISFDDILLIPEFSEIESRKNTNISLVTHVGAMNIPILSAPMDCVSGEKMISKLFDLGGLGVLHRFLSIETQVQIALNILATNKRAYYSVGATGDFLERTQALYNVGVRKFCIDIANGDSIVCHNAINSIFNTMDVDIITGNVCTGEACERLNDLGVAGVRVSIGGGSVCQTREVTGFGLTTAQAIKNCREYIDKKELDIAIIADGGLRKSSDLVKAFVLGADLVMLGGMLAGTDEAEGELVMRNDKWYKEYRGMASDAAQIAFTGKTKGSEGASGVVPLKGPVENIINDLIYGIRSGMSYGNAKRLKDLRKVTFVRISPNGLKENGIHANFQGEK